MEKATTAAIDSFRRTVDNSGRKAREVYATAIQSLSGLAAARHDWAKALTGKPAANYETLSVDTYVAYSTIVDALIAGTAQVPQEITDTTLRNGVEALYASLQTTEYEWQTVFDMYQASWDTGTNRAGDVYQASQDWGTALAWTSQLSSLGAGPTRHQSPPSAAACPRASASKALWPARCRWTSASCSPTRRRSWSP